MRLESWCRQLARLASSGVLVAMLAAPVSVGAQEQKGPNTGRISLSAGLDYTTDYYFRGIRQETIDPIIQPYGSVTFKLYEGKAWLTGLGLTLGTWNSLHWGPSGVEGNVSTNDLDLWYESDFIATLAAQLFEDLTFSTTYTAYMSPNGVFSTVQEVAFGLGYNDSKLLGPFALNPNVLLAVETAGQADAGAQKGLYLQIGVAPGRTFLSATSYPVSVSVPLTVGLGLRDYYQFAGNRDDDTFGYFSGGVTAGVPLAFIPASYGSWQLKGGIQFLFLGDNLRAANRAQDDRHQDGFEAIGTVGISLAY